MYKDLREWLLEVERLGQVVSVEGAHWDLEIGALTELAQRTGRSVPTFLFDKIEGYPAGYRVCVNHLSSIERVALTLGLQGLRHPAEFVAAWRKKWEKLEPVPPRVVDTGPVMENVHIGDEVNLLEFPAPRWHEEDGGRYLGTASITITRDPDEGWVNVGTYRVMVHDEKTLGFYISPGKHGRIHRDKHFARGEPCPVAISFGHDPLLFVVGSNSMPTGISEYEYAGAIKGEPIEVIEAPLTGLPVPAHAEIVIEGEAYPGETKVEGPFGEWTGYYASNARPEPFIRVKSVLHRNNPIILGSCPFRPPHADSLVRSLLQAALVWNEMEKAGIPDIKGVRLHEAGKSFLIIVSIKQRYPGHARQAALVASQCRAGAYMGRYVVVVDDDVDIWDIDQVIWAICTRSDPEQSIEILRRCWSGPLDPAIAPESKGFNSRAIIDACRPWERKGEFPRTVGVSDDLAAKMKEKWAALGII